MFGTRTILNLRRTLRSKRDHKRGWFNYFDHKVYFPENSYLHGLFLDSGSFEPHVWKLISNLARPETHVYDIGANIGLIAIPVLCENPTVSVTSVEPAPSVFKLLAETNRQSKNCERWTVVNKAVAESTRQIKFHEIIAGGDACSGILKTGRGGESREIDISAVRLDDLWREAGNPDVSVIKIDVEGAELGVLNGASACIEKNRPAIVVEWLPENYLNYGVSADDLFNWTSRFGYRIFEVQSLAEVRDSCTLHVCHVSNHEDFLLIPKEVAAL